MAFQHEFAWKTHFWASEAFDQRITRRQSSKSKNVRGQKAYFLLPISLPEVCLMHSVTDCIAKELTIYMAKTRHGISRVVVLVEFY